MAERKSKNDSSTKKRKATRPVSSEPSEPLSEPGQGEDLTQAGEVLYREIKEGKVDPSDSTPKPIKKSA